MKLWKGATFAFVLCGAALSILFVRNMATVEQFKSRRSSPYKSSSSSRPSSSSKSSPSYSSTADSAEMTQQMGGLHRRARSAEEMNSLLSECKINCYCLLFYVKGCCVTGIQGCRQNTSCLTLLFTEQVVLSAITCSQLAPHSSLALHRTIKTFKRG